MDNQNDFYITLCSNVSLVDHENTAANFVTQLPSPIVLDAGWKVGLSEIHFTNSWCNLRSDCRIEVRSVQPGVDENEVFNSFITLPAGRYDDIEELIDEISSKMKESATNHVEKLPVLNINSFTRRITMEYGYTVEGNLLLVKFDDDLAQLLGVSDGYLSSFAHQIVTLSDEKISINPSTSAGEIYISKRSYDLTGGIQSLFVYSDVVDYSIVGNTRAQLLRMAHIPSSTFGSNCVDRYENPHYFPLSTKEINSIEIHIKDDSNQTVGFEFGKVKLVLHFVRNG